MVQFETHRNRAESGSAAGFDVVNACDGRNRSFNRCGEKSTHSVGTGANVQSADQDRSAFDLGILLDGE